MAYSALAVARYIITRCYEEGYPISNLKLQKLLYYAQRSYLEERKEFLFNENICAWKYGPVVPDIYYQYCIYGGMPILEKHKNCLSLEAKFIIDTMIDKLKNLSAWDLVYKTHKENGVWSNVYNDGLGERLIIPKDMLKEDVLQKGAYPK